MANHVFKVKWFILDVALLQVIGIKGHNPSGHCLIASEIIDYIPLSDSSDENSQPAKKQALDEDLVQADLSHALLEISVVGYLASCIMII